MPIRSSSKERHRYIEDQGGEAGKVDSKLVIALRKSGTVEGREGVLSF